MSSSLSDRLRHAPPIFLGAFLMFAIQPLFARAILPWFGGGAGVWAACLCFFQAALLLGYGYAFVVTRRLSPRAQATLHLALLAASLALLPITPRPGGALDIAHPTLAILGEAVRTLGLPCVLVASTSPLLQSWLVLTSDRAPTRFYALSNLGSLLGLVTYPFVVEPLLGVRAQAQAWSVAYALFALTCAIAAWPLLGRRTGPGAVPSGRASTDDAVAGGPPSPPTTPTTRGVRVLWLALSTLGVVLLQAITHELTQNVPPVPFLWIVPLALYLVSFIVCFVDERVYQRRLWLGLFSFALIPTLWLAFVSSVVGLVPMVTLCSFTLFAGCMVCHGELAALRPARHALPGFYLTIAAGGVLGSLFVAVLAPLVFTQFWELHLGLVATFVVGGLCRRRTPGAAVVWLTGGALLLVLGVGPARSRVADIAVVRNFYGRVSVVDSEERDGPVRDMLNGRISHGAEHRDPAKRRTPRLYYAAGTGIAATLAYHARPGGRRIGVVGLGTGAIAAYGQAGDHVRFYELNPAVAELAERHFHYLSDSAARCDVVLGDARRALDAELARGEAGHTDILVLDAFSGDAIPVHLLTREAFAIYFRVLRPDGVLAINITNKYLDLAPIVQRLAQAAGHQAVRVTTRFAERGHGEVTWVLVTSDAAFLARPELAPLITPWRAPPGELWTDDASNLFGALK